MTLPEEAGESFPEEVAVMLQVKADGKVNLLQT